MLDYCIMWCHLSACLWLQVAGIIAGQLTLGFLADRIGRKWGSVITASLMLVGGILILASAGSNPRSLFLMYTTCQVCKPFLKLYRLLQHSLHKLPFLLLLGCFA